MTSFIFIFIKQTVRSLAILVPLLGIHSAAHSSPGSLSGSLIAEQTKGVVLTANNERGELISILVQNIEPDPHDPEGELSLYSVAVKSNNSNLWENMCSEDASGDSKAIPLSGYWDLQGNHVASDTVTFACTSGVLAKCARWGYKPWKDLPGISGRDLHQSCVRMARADYCGNGTSHTQDGTPINIYDRTGIQQRDPLDTMKFEAAWGPEGAVTLNRTRWPNTLEQLAIECPEKLDTIYAAEAYTHESSMTSFPQALIFNDSIPR